MKKFSLLACLMTVTAGLAVAQSTVSIPFFADSGTTSAFVVLQNTGAGTITITANYLDANGANGEAGGTFNLTAGQSISFRPFATIAGEIQPAGLANASYGFGSITFDIPGGGSVAGRYVQIGTSGSFAHNLAAGQ